MTTVQIHPDELYMAVLDAPIARGRNRTQELLYAFESHVPADTATLQTVFHQLRDKRVLAVAIPSQRVRELGSDATVAHPQFWPDWLDLPKKAVSPECVNLLVGPCTPEVVSRSRRATRHAVLLTIALAATLCSWGLERRIRHANSSAEVSRSSMNAMYDEALGTLEPRHQPPAAMLTAKLRELRSTRSVGSDLSDDSARADSMLAQILRNWPKDAMLRTDSIRISASVVEITAFADRAEDTTALINALQQIDELESVTSSSTQQQDEIRFEIRMHRIGEPS
jgi:hypothetical protein